MMNKELLKEGLYFYDIEATNEILERFDIYLNLLLEWNKKMNLTAITDEKDIIIKHFLDSISCVKTGVFYPDSNVIDIGTGAGFPGVPLKIVLNNIELTLIDSLNKRIMFLNELINKLGLKANIVHGRAEDYGVKKDYREKYDIVLCRAVARMNILVEYTLPYLKIGGFLLCMKGPGIFDEVNDAKKALEVLGGTIDNILSTQVYKSDFDHYIVKVKKVKECPGKYPRKAGIAEKNPIR